MYQKIAEEVHTIHTLEWMASAEFGWLNQAKLLLKRLSKKNCLKIHDRRVNTKIGIKSRNQQSESNDNYLSH